MLGSVYAFWTVFIVCELGQRIKDVCAEIGDMMYQCDWYLLPIEIKRFLVIILASLQQPVSLQCFGSISCERNIFEKVSLKS